MRFLYKTQRAPALSRENTRPPRPKNKGERARGSRSSRSRRRVALSMAMAEMAENKDSMRADAFQSRYDPKALGVS